ncbi:hypothetical protein JTE90_028993 [Oedothorax gibbosus]|uniref:Uncharacterized protein n=1 Tax=Oedothorax gibbosus TaxID=931172 RepID=A0AAV6VK03_9ARAC|nr:hypothetical protein JTE90_028993 [Oedothorax gibbosus]
MGRSYPSGASKRKIKQKIDEQNKQFKGSISKYTIKLNSKVLDSQLAEEQSITKASTSTQNEVLQFSSNESEATDALHSTHEMNVETSTTDSSKDVTHKNNELDTSVELLQL